MKQSCFSKKIKNNENVIARSVSDVAIFKGEIASPSARNDRIEGF
ncbi:MAG: hypothetical protein WC855_02060 [Thermodesulfovibrionales bacterium]